MRFTDLQRSSFISRLSSDEKKLTNSDVTHSGMLLHFLALDDFSITLDAIALRVLFTNVFWKNNIISPGKSTVTEAATKQRYLTMSISPLYSQIQNMATPTPDTAAGGQTTEPKEAMPDRA